MYIIYHVFYPVEIYCKYSVSVKVCTLFIDSYRILVQTAVQGTRRLTGLAVSHILEPYDFIYHCKYDLCCIVLLAAKSRISRNHTTVYCMGSSLPCCILKPHKDTHAIIFNQTALAYTKAIAFSVVNTIVLLQDMVLRSQDSRGQTLDLFDLNKFRESFDFFSLGREHTSVLWLPLVAQKSVLPETQPEISLKMGIFLLIYLHSD